jgi:hypothetical protein
MIRVTLTLDLCFTFRRKLIEDAEQLRRLVAIAVLPY